jgi:hypothetical protein
MGSPPIVPTIKPSRGIKPKYFVSMSESVKTPSALILLPIICRKNTAALMIKRFLITCGKTLNPPNPLGLYELLKLFLYLNIIKYL